MVFKKHEFQDYHGLCRKETARSGGPFKLLQRWGALVDQGSAVVGCAGWVLGWTLAIVASGLGFEQGHHVVNLASLVLHELRVDCMLACRFDDVGVTLELERGLEAVLLSEELEATLSLIRLLAAAAVVEAPALDPLLLLVDEVEVELAADCAHFLELRFVWQGRGDGEIRLGSQVLSLCRPCPVL